MEVMLGEALRLRVGEMPVLGVGVGVLVKVAVAVPEAHSTKTPIVPGTSGLAMQAPALTCACSSQEFKAHTALRQTRAVNAGGMFLESKQYALISDVFSGPSRTQRPAQQREWESQAATSAGEARHCSYRRSQTVIGITLKIEYWYYTIVTV